MAGILVGGVVVGRVVVGVVVVGVVVVGVVVVGVMLVRDVPVVVNDSGFPSDDDSSVVFRDTIVFSRFASIFLDVLIFCVVVVD